MCSIPGRPYTDLSVSVTVRHLSRDTGKTSEHIWMSSEKSIVGITTSITHMIKPLSPHDALKHHFTSQKTNLIPLQLGVLE